MNVNIEVSYVLISIFINCYSNLVLRASTLQSINLGFNPLVTASLLGAQHLEQVVENKPASSLVVLGQST